MVPVAGPTVRADERVGPTGSNDARAGCPGVEEIRW